MILSAGCAQNELTAGDTRLCQHRARRLTQDGTPVNPPPRECASPRCHTHRGHSALRQSFVVTTQKKLFCCVSAPIVCVCVRAFVRICVFVNAWESISFANCMTARLTSAIWGGVAERRPHLYSTNGPGPFLF